VEESREELVEEECIWISKALPQSEVNGKYLHSAPDGNPTELLVFSPGAVLQHFDATMNPAKDQETERRPHIGCIRTLFKTLSGTIPAFCPASSIFHIQ
jgi:hypothetical protein